MDRKSEWVAAERLTGSRARTMPVLLAVFVAQQASFFLGTGLGTGDRPIQNVQILAWLSLSTVILLFLTTGGGWTYSRQARQLADDETSRANRDAALRLGFVSSMATGMLVHVLSLLHPLSAQESVHAVMSLGLAAALFRFAQLERRALKNG